MKFFSHIDGHDYEVHVERAREGYRMTLEGKEIPLVLEGERSNVRTAFIGSKQIEFGWMRRDNGYEILIDGAIYSIVVRDSRSELLSRAIPADGKSLDAIEVSAPIPGLVMRVLVRSGETVRKDQPLVTLDAMKLENEIQSPRDGRVKAVPVKPGMAVAKGQTLVILQ